MATQISKETYFSFALSHLSIDMDRKGTFAKVPSEKHSKISYRVGIDESRPADVHATDCQCPDRLFRNAYCKHMQVVDLFYTRLLAPYNEAIPAADVKNDKVDTISIVYDFYEVRAVEINEASKIDSAPLNQHRTPVVVTGHVSSTERDMAARGWLK
jgi:hypothetical protein